MSPQAPRVSIVIVHYRTPDVLERCLEKIRSAGIRFDHEVIVVDNAPLDDRSARAATGAGARYFKNERNVGFGRAVNRGLKEGAGEYLLVLNPDVEVQPGSVEELVAEMERNAAAGIVAPKLLYPDGTLQHSCRTYYTLPVFLLRRTFLGRIFPNHRLMREHLMLDYDHDSTRAVDWCIGASLLVRRRALEDVGPMDERFFLYFEDVDWCNRMQTRGWKVLYHPAATMIHHYARESARRPGKGLLLHLASTFRYYEKWSFILYWFKLRTATIRRIVLILSDFVAVNLAFLAAYWIRDLTSGILTKPTFGFGRYARFLLFSDAVALLAMALAGMYRSRRREEAGEQVLGAGRALAATALIMMASTFLFATPVYSRLVVGLFLPLAFVMILLLRWGIFSLQGSARSRRLHLRRVGVLAPPEALAEVERRLERHPEFGFDILPLTGEAAILGSPRGGRPAEVDEAIRLWVNDERIHEVVLFEDWPGGGIDRILARLNRDAIPTRLVPRVHGALRRGARMGDFLGFPALHLTAAGPAARSWEKRLADGAFAVIAMLLAAAPFAVARLGVALAGKGLVRNEWIGRGGKRIRGSRLPGRLPPGLFRVVWEYPTLLLWLRGEWSLVGIHPFPAGSWDSLPEDYRRLPPDAAPGWVTLAGDPAGQSMEALCAANIEYAGRHSLALDLNLILERCRRVKGKR